MNNVKGYDRHTHFVVNKITPIEYCGNTIGYQFNVDGGYELPYDTTFTKGEHDFKECDKCQTSLLTLIERFEKRYNGTSEKNKFPNCCKWHSNLVNVKEFNRIEFTNVPKMAAHKIIYTNQHFINNIKTENWEKSITDYIEWTVDSFGQMPNGCGEPLFVNDYLEYITELINAAKKVPRDRKNKILRFINNYSQPKTKKGTDFNILVRTYENWVKIFPWEISFFQNLQERYKKNIPVFSSTPEVNTYSGLARVKMHSKVSLIDFLVQLTNDILTKINTLTLYDKGLLTQIEQVQLELIINERRLKLKKVDSIQSDSEEQRYRTILKEWFKDEKQFLIDVKPFLNKGEGKTEEQKPNYKTNFEFGSQDAKIFYSNTGYNIFMAFKSEIVKPETELADYSYVYTKLKSDGFLKDVKQKEMIAYLSLYHNSTIESKGHIQFKFSKTPMKDRAYNRIRKLYQLE